MLQAVHHVLIPQTTLFELFHEVLVYHHEITREVGFGKKILIGWLD